MIQDKFYMAVSEGEIEAIAGLCDSLGIPVLRSVYAGWSGDQLGSLSWEPRANFVMDSGGYNVLQDYDDYPWSARDYCEALEAHKGKLDWAATMDYPYSDDHHLSVPECIEGTVENTIDLLNEDPPVPILPILQGQDPIDYVRCWEQYRDHGIEVSEVGVGNLVHFSNKSEVVKVESMVRDETDVERMHGFGVKISGIKAGATFESADSAAWAYPIKFGQFRPYSGNGVHGVDTKGEYDSDIISAHNFISYYVAARDAMFSTDADIKSAGEASW